MNVTTDTQVIDALREALQNMVTEFSFVERDEITQKVYEQAHTALKLAKVSA